MKTEHTVDDVFGITRDIPLNYVTREEVDTKFVDSLSRNQHIVIYGSSKQGKTSLRKKLLSDSDYILVSCQNRWTLAELHSSILKEAGFSIKQSVEKTVSGHNKISAGFAFKGKVPLFAEGSGNTSFETQSATSEKEVHKSLDIDPSDPNDIIRALQEISFSKYITLEDFHYLPDETQRDFSFSLKTFHESSKLSFIIVGVWREENRLISFNGDLTDRVLSVDVDTWTSTSLAEVMDAGSALLNIEFDQKFREDLINKCFDSVHLVQEACRRACRISNVFSTASSITTVGQDLDVTDLIRRVVSEQAARYKGFLEGFSAGFQETDLEMPKWIIFALLCNSVDQIEKGIRLRRISGMIKLRHPKGKNLNNGNITQILNSATSLQNKKGTRPLVIAYDATNTSLHVVDKGFLIWLAAQDIAELCADLDLESPLSEAELNTL